MNIRQIFLRSGLAAVSAAFLLLVPAGPARAQDQPRFIGSARCGECHQEQYDRFIKNSKKAQSWKSVERMKSNLKPEELQGCYDCHTTGHGRPGGFVSYEKTPELADVGCETCHGPGETHAQTGDPADIKLSPSIEDCKTCHNGDRIKDFNFKPLRFSGAH